MHLFDAFRALLAKLASMPETPIEPPPAGKRTVPPPCPNCKGQGWMPCVCSVGHLCPICFGSAVVPAVYRPGMIAGPDCLEARIAYVREAARRN